MNSFNGAKAVTAGIVILGLAGAAIAERPASEGVELSAIVPVSCNVQASPIELSPAANAVESDVQVACNTSDGFEIVANYRPLSFGETASITYAGTTVPLDASGSASVLLAASGLYGVQPVLISGAGLVDPLVVTFQARPL